MVEGATANAGQPDGADELPGWQPFADLVRAAWAELEAGAEPGAGEPGSWQIVRAIDLLDETVDLTPARHLGSGDSTASPERTLEKVRRQAAELRAILAVLDDCFRVDGWSAGEKIPEWRTATVADLARQGSLDFYRLPGKGRTNTTDAEAGTSATDESPRPGDVLVPAAVVGQIAAAGAVAATVVDERGGHPAKGQFHVIRPDPALLDPWFLAGFLAAPASVQQASYGTGIMRRIDARRLTVPILPLEQQQRYGEVFKRLHNLSATVTAARDRANDLTSLLVRSLADGSLQPPETNVKRP